MMLFTTSSFSQYDKYDTSDASSDNMDDTTFIQKMTNASHGFYIDSLVNYDSTDYEIREFDKSKFIKFKKDRNFNYLRNEAPQFDLMEYIWNLIDRFIIYPIQKMVGLARAHYLLGFIILILAIFVVIMIIRKKRATGIDKKLSNPNANFTFNLKDVHSIDFEGEIDKCLKNNDYSGAVRLQFLKNLKVLFDTGVLKFHISKTNSDYLKEIKRKELAHHFTKLSDIFNYVSYGKFELTKPDYSLIIKIFNDFSEKVMKYEQS
ncbi:MAG: hypothetical protein KIT33_14155 [Candidatus Kapabacteria bacterium]|nr:hypothetical protein [Ignavibacteriota bacterium]MCW5886110.1 hypothetical protein [Candidatus Kapabacteria bacterium]